MAFNPINERDILPGRPSSSIDLWDKVKNNFDYLHGYQGSGTSGDNLIINPSFEIDADNNLLPDSWHIHTIFPGGKIELVPNPNDNTRPLEGKRSLKISTTGGAGNGGGIIESDYFPVMYTNYYTFDINNNSMFDKATIVCYDENGVYLGEYDLGALSRHFQPMDQARFCRLKLTVFPVGSRPGPVYSLLDEVTVKKGISIDNDYIQMAKDPVIKEVSYIDPILYRFNISLFRNPTCPYAELKFYAGISNQSPEPQQGLKFVARSEGVNIGEIEIPQTGTAYTLPAWTIPVTSGSAVFECIVPGVGIGKTQTIQLHIRSPFIIPICCSINELTRG